MIKIGVILFGIGLLLISPLDEILILIPLSTVVGLWIIPLVMVIGLACLLIGAILIGKHLITVLKKPIVMIMFAFTIAILLYYIFTEGWIKI